MIVEMFSVYDKAVRGFMPVFGARSKGEAIRSFTDLANDTKTNVANHPSDYVLFYVGTFDDSSGVFGPCEPTRILGAYEVVRDVAGPSPNGGMTDALPNGFGDMRRPD